MGGASKLSGRAGRLLVPAVLAVAVLSAWVGRRRDDSAASAVPLDEWDIPRLTAYLNEAGLRLRIVSTTKHGALDPTVFLTTTNKGWDDLNRLPKGFKQIDRWQGTLYCERGQVEILMRDDWSALARQWGDCCLVAEPFLFFTAIRNCSTASAPPWPHSHGRGIESRHPSSDEDSGRAVRRRGVSQA